MNYRKTEKKNSALEESVADLTTELHWFTQVLDTRLKLYFGQESEHQDIEEIQPPEPSDSEYGRCIREHGLGFAERIALMLALVPQLNPRLLDVFFTKNATFDRPFTEFGGYSHPQHQGFLPTGETLAFLLAGNDLRRRLEALQLFAPEHPFRRYRLLALEPGPENGPLLSGRLALAPDLLHRLCTGREYQPEYSAQFPAQHIETLQAWDNLVLPQQTVMQIREIADWIRYGPTLMDDWGMRRKLRPGFRCLFYGPPGVGKTMTACLLGKSTGKPVFRIDLSQVVSKYIGETEKNLARIFDQAEHKNWILFFDEADALFGKRTEIRDAHDRYANQEVSFLLQRIETFDGVVILASNQRENLDSAFTRRFESMIYFPLPKAEQRMQLWQQGFSPKATLAPEIDLRQLARQYELSGGGIMNVVRYASLQAIANGGTVKLEDVMEGVRREYGKEGRGV
jgi:hypothetical protein